MTNPAINIQLIPTTAMYVGNNAAVLDVRLGDESNPSNVLTDESDNPIVPDH